MPYKSGGKAKKKIVKKKFVSKKKPAVNRRQNNNSRNQTGHKNKSSSSDDPMIQRIEAEILDSCPNVHFSDVAGLSDVKQALHESIILPNLRPDIFTGLRAPPKGLLLFGPPGNGKTMIAKAVATECSATFFNISASSLTSKYVGEAEKMVRAMFSVAAERAPSIIFIDEIDSLLTSRGGNNEAESSRRLKTEFLVQFDGVGSSENRILVIGATNLPWELDEAVIRRFTKRILVPLPDPETRYFLLEKLLETTPHNLSGSNLNNITRHAEGFSGSDLKALTSDAAMGPIREISDIANIETGQIPPVQESHFIESLRIIRPSTSQSMLKTYRDWNDQYGSKISVKKRPRNSSRGNGSKLFGLF